MASSTASSSPELDNFGWHLLAACVRFRTRNHVGSFFVPLRPCCDSGATQSAGSSATPVKSVRGLHLGGDVHVCAPFVGIHGPREMPARASTLLHSRSCAFSSGPRCEREARGERRGRAHHPPWLVKAWSHATGWQRHDTVPLVTVARASFENFRLNLAAVWRGCSS